MAKATGDPPMPQWPPQRPVSQMQIQQVIKQLKIQNNILIAIASSLHAMNGASNDWSGKVLDGLSQAIGDI